MRMRTHEYGVLAGAASSKNMSDWGLALFSELSDLESHLRGAIDAEADSFYLLRYHPLTTPISKEVAYNVQGAGRLSLTPPDVYQASLSLDLWPPDRKPDRGDRVKVHKYSLLSGSPQTKDYHDWWLTFFSERDDLDKHIQVAMDSDSDSFVVFEHHPTAEPTSEVVRYNVIQIGRLGDGASEATLNG